MDVLTRLVEIAGSVLHAPVNTIATNLPIRNLFGGDLNSPTIMEFYFSLPDEFDVEIKDDITADELMLDCTLEDLAKSIEKHGRYTD